MIPEKVIQEALEVAMSTGADFVELFGERTRNNNIRMLNGKIDAIPVLTQKLLLNVICPIFVYIKNDDTLGCKGCYLTAKLASDASTATCDEHGLVFVKIGYLGVYHIKRGTEEKLLDVEFSEMPAVGSCLLYCGIIVGLCSQAHLGVVVIEHLHFIGALA